jgi:hypothetical protein
MAVRGSFYSPDEVTQEAHLNQKKETPQTSNGFCQNFLRLDLLTRTTN